MNGYVRGAHAPWRVGLGALAQAPASPEPCAPARIFDEGVENNTRGRVCSPNFARLLVLLLLFVLSLDRAAATPAEDFAQGNVAYSEGRFPDAIQKYDALVRHGENRAELFLNLGNAWQKSGNNARAVLNYERALQLDPALAAARDNLTFVQSKLDTPRKESRWWMRLPLLGASLTAVLAASMFWIFLLAWAARWRRLFGAQTIWTFLLSISFLAALLLGADFYFREWPLASPRRAVLLQNTPLRVTFNDDGPVLANLTSGRIVRVVSMNGPWTNCKLDDGTQGWLVSDSLEKIVPAS